jgi:hypothetical protein
MREDYVDSLKEVCPDIEVIENLPKISDICNSMGKSTLVIIDDNIQQLFASAEICQLMFVHRKVDDSEPLSFDYLFSLIPHPKKNNFFFLVRILQHKLSS